MESLAEYLNQEPEGYPDDFDHNLWIGAQTLIEFYDANFHNRVGIDFRGFTPPPSLMRVRVVGHVKGVQHIEENHPGYIPWNVLDSYQF